MSKQHFTIDIKAPKQKVWDIMLADKTYRQWTEVFNPGGSYYQGDWQQGSKMLFLGPGEDGKVGGMVSRVAKNQPHEFLSIEHLGLVADGVEDTTSEQAKSWAGSTESYTFTEKDGVTTVDVDLEAHSMPKEFVDMFEGMWPKALTKLKQIVEQAA